MSTPHLAPELVRLLVAHARERRRPLTASELGKAAGHPTHALGEPLQVISRHCEQLKLPDLASLVCREESGAPQADWRPGLPPAERLVSAWEEQARLWAFDEWLKYEELILRIQRMG
ncbi:MAG TPA: hypothetical protein VF804_06155 [Holophagaceae bacterium]